MKKLFLLLAACGLMVACGGEQKKEDKAAADQNKQEQNDGKSTVDPEKAAEVKAPATALEFVKASVEAAKAEDVVKYVDLQVAAEEFIKKLYENEEELMKQMMEVEAWMSDEKNAADMRVADEFAWSKEVRAEMEKRAEAEWEKYNMTQDCDCCEAECADECNVEQCCVDCEETMLYEGDCDCCVDCEETMLYEVECEGECCDEDYDYADEDYEDEWSDEEEW